MHRQFSIKPRRRERLVNLAEFSRPTAPPEAEQPPIETALLHVPEETEGKNPVVDASHE